MDADLTTVIHRCCHSGGVCSGVSRAFQNEIIGEGEAWREGVADEHFGYSRHGADAADGSERKIEGFAAGVT